jgi:hypothetical protein
MGQPPWVKNPLRAQIFADTHTPKTYLTDKKKDMNKKWSFSLELRSPRAGKHAADFD